MTERFADQPDVNAFFEKRNCKQMPESVRTSVHDSRVLKHFPTELVVHRARRLRSRLANSEKMMPVAILQA
jgi:hypothetical protein